MKYFVLLALIGCWMGCCIGCRENSKPVFEDNNCKLVPPFVARLGFNTRNAYFSTSEKQTMGLVLLEAVDPNNPAAGHTKKYQDSTWKKAGWLAPIQLDDRGNIFTAPAPFISVLFNPFTDQNTIYKVNGQNGKMEAFIRLPAADSVTDQNPYGILGMVYYCATGTLYVSSVAGSNRQSQKGCIYAVDTKTGTIVDKITGVDALGMGISYSTGEDRLFFGSARTPEVFSVKIGNDGRFDGKFGYAFTLAGLGSRGDDKVRRIRTSKDGSLMVYGMEFNFNLVAPTEKQESVYRFYYDETQKQWLADPHPHVPISQ